MRVEAFREHFPAAATGPYFATNGYGLLPTTARDAVVEAVGRLSDRGYAAHARYERGVDDVRARLAAMIGATADEVGFVRNTADGMGFAAESLPTEPDDEVVVFDGDYGTVVYPFLARQRRGELMVRVVAPPPDGVITAEVVAAAIRPNTKAIALSWVRFDSGARSDIAAIGHVCRERGVWCIVDAIQGLGVFPLDVHAAGVDVVAAGCHKWQCGLAGLGVLYVAAERWASLRPTRAGLDAFDHPADSLSTGYPFELRPSVARVEDGAKPEVAIAALGASLTLFEAVGMAAVSAQVRTVTDALCAGWRDLGGVVRSPRHADSWSGIVALESPPSIDGRGLLADLVRGGAALGERNGALWIGAHAYTTVTDAEFVLAAARSRR